MYIWFINQIVYIKKGNVNMQSIRKEKWEKLEQSKTISNLYAYAYSDFTSAMEVANFFNKKNTGMYSKAFKDYENILFERKHKMPSWKSDKFRSLSQPLINIIKRDTNITKLTDLKKAINILDQVKKELNAKDVIYKDDIAKVSVIGVGMRSHTGVAAKMFEALAKEDINIEMISTSEIKVSCVIKEEEVKKSVTVLHKAFELNKIKR